MIINLLKHLTSAKVKKNIVSPHTEKKYIVHNSKDLKCLFLFVYFRMIVSAKLTSLNKFPGSSF